MFRPDPLRAIYIEGPFDDKLLTKITPQILRFLAHNRKPITAYILDSPGGNTAVAQGILRMLHSSNQDSEKPCRLITVVTAKAQSAAADLLSAGDYAIAYPDSSLLYHGIRIPALIPSLQSLTAERTSLLAHLIRITSDAFAMELSRRAEGRFSFRFWSLFPTFAEIRKKSPKLTDFNCFVKHVTPRLSKGAQKVFAKAQTRYERYQPLLERLAAKKKGGKKNKVTDEEARQIKAIVDFEREENKAKAGWTFKHDGLSRITEDFFQIAEYIETIEGKRLDKWCKQFGRVGLDNDALQEIDAIADEKARDEALIAKVKPSIQPLLSFFIALCHALQEDDNELSAVDAYWLGLIDEVNGADDLLTLRWFAEWKTDEPKPEATKPTLPPEQNKTETPQESPKDEKTKEQKQEKNGTSAAAGA
jgi:ATP-dependent protease ClpP protease subunit